MDVRDSEIVELLNQVEELEKKLFAHPMHKKLGHTDADGVVQLRGRAACLIDTGDELLVIELMFNELARPLQQIQDSVRRIAESHGDVLRVLKVYPFLATITTFQFGFASLVITEQSSQEVNVQKMTTSIPPLRDVRKEEFEL
ncbi:DExH-box ATP-dependent RNA helicase DExH10 [Glycine soja]